MTLLTDDLRRRDIDWAPLRKLTQEWRRITGTGCYFGDYYPLTPYNRNENQWIGWQFHRPDTGTGIVQLFRRAESSCETACFQLQGLEPGAQYALTDIDAGTPETCLGRHLMETGLPVTVQNTPGAVVILYELFRDDKKISK